VRKESREIKIKFCCSGEDNLSKNWIILEKIREILVKTLPIVQIQEKEEEQYYSSSKIRLILERYQTFYENNFVTSKKYDIHTVNEYCWNDTN